jgi:hypothetical protein
MPFLNDSFRQPKANRSQVHRSHVPWKTPKITRFSKQPSLPTNCGTHNGQALHHVYFENGPGAIGGQAAAKVEVRFANVAKLLDYMLSAYASALRDFRTGRNCKP